MLILKKPYHVRIIPVSEKEIREARAHLQEKPILITPQPFKTNCKKLSLLHQIRARIDAKEHITQSKELYEELGDTDKKLIQHERALYALSQIESIHASTFSLKDHFDRKINEIANPEWRIDYMVCIGLECTSSTSDVFDVMERYFELREPFMKGPEWFSEKNPFKIALRILARKMIMLNWNNVRGLRKLFSHISPIDPLVIGHIPFTKNFRYHVDFNIEEARLCFSRICTQSSIRTLKKLHTSYTESEEYWKNVLVINELAKRF